MTDIVTPTIIQPMPPAPVLTDTQADFNSKAFATVGAFPVFIEEANAMAAATHANSLVAEESATSAQSSEEAAISARDAAAQSANTALNAPGTSGTTGSALNVSAGTKSFTTQSGKAWAVGQSVLLARTSEPTATRMFGSIASYNATSGAMVVQVPADAFAGVGTHSDWTISLTATREGLAWLHDVEQLRTDFGEPGAAQALGYSQSESVDDALNSIARTSVFGRSGMRIIVGQKDNAHYGWGGIVAFPSGKMVFIHRRGTDHAILDYSELRAIDSYDGGATWANDRLVAAPGAHDVRPDPPRLMGNNRMGFFVNRQDEGTTHFSPWFVKSDDEGVTFQVTPVTTASPYTFQGHSGLMDFPASQGGHDTLGFVSFGYLSAGGIDAFCTSDNGNTWTQVQDVGVASGAIVSISETIGVRIGSQNKWLFYARASDSAGWHQQMTVFATTNMLSWGAARDSGLELGGNPPGGLYDPATGQVNILNFSRGPTRSIDGTEQSLMSASAPGDALFAANGVFSALGIGYRELAVVPYWATGYIAPFRYRGGWYATFTCGEPGVSGNAHSVEVLIGNFTSSATDMTQIVRWLMKRQRQVRSMDMVAEDDSPTNWPLYFHNRSNTVTLRIGAYSSFHVGAGSPYVQQSDVGFVYTAPYNLFGGLTAPISGQLGAVQVGVQGVTIPAIVTYVGSTSNRKNLVFRNANGEVGSVSSNDFTTGFNTTSDETLKNFDGELDAQAAIDIIKADPVRRFRWKASGTAAVGWGAQTSYAVSKDLATPGGWFDAEGEPCNEAATGAVYVPWGVDQSKRTPYLWAVCSFLVDEVKSLKAELADLRNGA